MSRTITAMFDSRNEAESARQRLTASSIDADRVRIIDKNSSGGDATSEDTETRGFWAQMKELFVSEEDRHSYAEGIDRGGFLLTAEVEEDDADRACQTLEQSSSVDFETREQSWRKDDSWTGYAGAGSPMGSFTTPPTGASAGGASGEPFGQEPGRLGTRDHQRGSPKVRSYARETGGAETRSAFGGFQSDQNRTSKGTETNRTTGDADLERTDRDRGV